MRIFACPDCKCRKFTSLNGLNVHMTKSHTLNYKIDNQKKQSVYKQPKNKRSKATILHKVKFTPRLTIRSLVHKYTLIMRIVDMPIHIAFKLCKATQWGC